MRPGRKKPGDYSYRLQNDIVSKTSERLPLSDCASTREWKPRICKLCKKPFYIMFRCLHAKRMKIDIPRYILGARVTNYKNQKVCPDCKDKKRNEEPGKICKSCHQIFYPSKSNAMTCSVKCRKRLQRERGIGIKSSSLFAILTSSHNR